MSKTGVSLLTLWKHLKGNHTAHGYQIVVTTSAENWDGSYPAPDEKLLDSAYFDLCDTDGCVCCDGEECLFEKKGHDYVMTNNEGETTTTFTLTEEEFGVATFK